MHFVGRHGVPKLLRALDTGGEDDRLHLLEDEIDRFYRSLRLRSHHGTKGGHFLPRAHDGFLAAVPNDQARHDYNDHEQTSPGERKVSTGTKRQVLEAVGFHHRDANERYLATNEDLMTRFSRAGISVRSEALDVRLGGHIGLTAGGQLADALPIMPGAFVVAVQAADIAAF